MATNHYFNHFPKVRTNEQMLVQELVTETIQIMGHDCYYIPRESWSSVDYIFGEDASSKFTKAYNIEMYIETGNMLGGDNHFDGMNDMFTQFGAEIQDDANFLVSRQSFERWIPTSTRNHPREGDLVYVPLWDKIFEIKFVEQDIFFFQVGHRVPYAFELRCESFRYSDEDLDTGVEEIDQIELDNSYTQQLTLISGTGDYHIGESVSVDAATTANVVSWVSTNGTITIVDVKGQFNTGTLVGASSNAQWSISTVDELGDHSRFDFYDNKRFEDDANTILDKTTEVNPLGVS